MPTVRPWRLSAETRQVRFEVLGIAKPKGSLSAFTLPNGHAILTEPKHHKAWQREVRDGAVATVGEDGPLEGALWVRMVFYLPRPKSAPKTVRTVPTTKPDIDKLCRSALDGMTGVVFHDDSQVAMCVHAKVYSRRPRVAVEVRALDADDLAWIGAGSEDAEGW